MFHLDPKKIFWKKKIDGGTFGEVYPYKDPDGKNSVVKKIKADSIKSLFKSFQEVVLGFSCHHPAIISTSGYCIEHLPSNERSDEFNVYIRMPRMMQNLQNFIEENIKENRKLSLEEIVKKLHTLASGIEYLHGRKIAHRDIKPRNILMDSEENVLLSDIGSAVFVPEDEHSLTIGIVEGTLKYMAPEILKKYGKVKKKMFYKGDVWSLGLSIAQLCLMEFQDATKNHEKKIDEIIKRIQDNYGEPLASIIKGMLRIDQNERTHIKDVLKGLEEHFEDILLGKK